MTPLYATVAEVVALAALNLLVGFRLAVYKFKAAEVVADKNPPKQVKMTQFLFQSVQSLPLFYTLK